MRSMVEGASAPSKITSFLVCERCPLRLASRDTSPASQGRTMKLRMLTKFRPRNRPIMNLIWTISKTQSANARPK